MTAQHREFGELAGEDVSGFAAAENPGTAACFANEQMTASRMPADNLINRPRDTTAGRLSPVPGWLDVVAPLAEGRKTDHRFDRG